MKISELWLRKWANPAISIEDLVAQLTMAGLEVESCDPVAGKFEKVVVAKVLKTMPHPQADRLCICEVDAALETPLQIVCGAVNVRPGLNVALALVGATLPGGIKIKKTKLRGELSQGMLCSAAELGLEEQSEGILELPEEAPIGHNLRAYMDLDDHMLEINLTPNRADCFSVLGVAREVAALNDLKLQENFPEEKQPEIDARFEINIKESEACPVYCARVIEGINPEAKTPLWLQERLRRSGIRPLHPVVDITNYVMLEYGQPMHAFDSDALEGGICVRNARSGEHLVLLNEQPIDLQENVLVIADAAKVLAIAGVMGGASSSVTDDTTSILLESAFFSPKKIAGIARHYGLCTDSSQRFERGVDPCIQRLAIERASQLIVEISGGKKGPIECRKFEDKIPKRRRIDFEPSLVKRLTGIDIAPEQMAKILAKLGMNVSRHSQPWQVDAPSFRFDIEQPVDLVEEIIRQYGYEKLIPETLLVPNKVGQMSCKEKTRLKLAEFLKSKGYHETISYSFVDPALQDEIYQSQTPLKLINPISQELSQMRVGLWPGLIASFIHNTHRQQSSMKLFEMGVVFNLIENRIVETSRVAGLLSGEVGQLNWSEEKRAYDFFDLKGDLESLFSLFHSHSVQFMPGLHPALHPGKTAKIILQQKTVGWVGAMHPNLLNQLDLTQDVFLFEFDLDIFEKMPTKQYQRISKYPKISRDLALLVDEKVLAQQIEATVRNVVDPNLLKSFHIFDLYTGKHISEGKKSLAINLVLQNENRTMIDDEVNQIISAILKSLKEEFSITLRD